MTTSTPTLKNVIVREWTKFAPQIIAFFAAGVPAAAIVTILGFVGIHIPATLATILAGGIASIAAYIKNDDLLKESAKALTGKLAAFIVSGLSATTVIAVLAAFHVSIPSWAAAALPIVLGLISGYFKSDTAIPLAIVSSSDGTPSVGTLPQS